MSSGKYRKEHNCLNCGHHVEAHYCSQCGQPNIELRESFWAFIIHSIGHYLHFDSKFFQTLVPLLTKPGKVTLDYLAGKRARYINPVSMYIFVSIVYFLIVPGATQENVHKKEISDIQKQQTAASLDSVKLALSNRSNRLGGVFKSSIDLAAIALTKSEFKKMDFNQQRIYLDSLNQRNQQLKSDSLSDVIADFQELHMIKSDSTYEAYLARQAKLPKSEQDSWIDRRFKKKEIDYGNKLASGEWTLKAEVEKYRPKQYFLLMPLLAFFIMLNFRRNHIYYLDHLIFTIHGMTAYFIVSIIYTPIVKYVFGIGSIVGEVVEFGVVIWICWYLYKGLKVFYNRSRAATITKMVWLFILYGFSLWVTEKVIENAIYYVLM